MRSIDPIVVDGGISIVRLPLSFRIDPRHCENEPAGSAGGGGLCRVAWVWDVGCVLRGVAVQVNER